MSDLGKDKFEEFLKSSLEDYSSSDAPNWEEMESRLDEVQTGSSGDSGILTGSMAKWIAGLVVTGGILLLVANIINNDKEQNTTSENATRESFMDKIRALTIEEDANDVQQSVEMSSNEDTNNQGRSIEDRNSGDRQTQKSEMQNQNRTQSKATEFGFTKPVAPVYYEPSGPTYDMLRAEYKNKPTPAPVASFGSDLKEGCVPLKLNFKLESQDVAMKYFWNFGDGTYSTDPNPVHIYDETGSYNVELTVTSLINQKFVIEVSSDPVIVYGLPEVAFNWDTDENKAGNEVTFIDLSSNVIDWYWSFGDRSFSDIENPTHAYNEEGTYIVELIGIDANGCADTLTSTIRISGKKLTHNFFAPKNASKSSCQ